VSDEAPGTPPARPGGDPTYIVQRPAAAVGTERDSVDNSARRRGGNRPDLFLRWLPFVLMGAAALVDLFAGPSTGYRELLALGPAFASLSCGVRRIVGVGLLAALACTVLAVHDQVFGVRQHALACVAIVGVTVAGVLAGRRRERREQELATVRGVAEVAQRVLLGPVPETVGPVHVAVNYTSAAAEARIGGDLYEIIVTPHGVRGIIGDVQGKGLEAVETAAAVVGAFREAAYDEGGLAAVVARLETTLRRRLGDERFVTAVLVQITGDTATLLNCGHPAPLLAGCDGSVRLVEPAATAPPLGMVDLAEARRRPETIRFGAGDQMLLYTDGVIEARDAAGRFYPLPERAHLLKAADAQEALRDLQADLLAHVDGSIADDAAMLLIRAPSRRARAAGA
jgi:serine phosphatase RsbU (regulator of sigma subunit)